MIWIGGVLLERSEVVAVQEGGMDWCTIYLKGGAAISVSAPVDEVMRKLRLTPVSPGASDSDEGDG